MIEQERSSRIGLLEQGDSACFCLIISLSWREAKVTVFGAPAPGKLVRLHVGDSPPVRGRIDRSEGQKARIKLDARDVATASIRRALKRRRIPRLAAQAPAVLTTGGRAYFAQVLNISTIGAKIVTSRFAAFDETSFLHVRGLPPLRVFPRWNLDREAGLSFATPIPLELIANWWGTVNVRASANGGRGGLLPSRVITPTPPGARILER
jgi:hypothetical protein